MGCVRVNIPWKILHSRWTVVIRLQWNALYWTLSGSYFTAGGQWYCSLNGVRYSERYLDHTSEQVDSVIAFWMECVSVNVIWKTLRCTWTVVLQVEWSVLQWTSAGRYFKAWGQWFSLNGVRYSEHHLEDTSQHVDSGNAAWMKCVKVNIIWKILHSTWTVVKRLEWSASKWTSAGRYFTAWGQW